MAARVLIFKKDFGANIAVRLQKESNKDPRQFFCWLYFGFLASILGKRKETLSCMQIKLIKYFLEKVY